MITGVLGMGRRMAESRMSDMCKVSRFEKVGVPDEESGTYPVIEIISYVGPCRVKHPSTSGKDVDAGSQLLVISQVEVHLPLSAVGVLPGDEVLVTLCPTRPDQVGRKFTIDSAFDGSQTTALRYRCEVDDGR